MGVNAMWLSTVLVPKDLKCREVCSKAEVLIQPQEAFLSLKEITKQLTKIEREIWMIYIHFKVMLMLINSPQCRREIMPSYKGLSWEMQIHIQWNKFLVNIKLWITITQMVNTNLK